MNIRFTPEALSRVKTVGTWWRRHGIVPTYSVDENEVVVHMIWGARRGRGPTL